jgi:polysaccharide deacetylase 2 family uncharacterized protein YibQ
MAAATLGSPATGSAEPAPKAIYIALIIDDLGNNRFTDERATRLPGPVACAVLPHTPHGVTVADAAHAQNKEVLLHLPMESLDEREPGPGTLDSSMFQEEFTQMVSYDLASVPHVVGINNHMGSRLTADAAYMRQLMQQMHKRSDLFFIDSRTNPASVAAAAARESGVPTLSRDVFLDNEPTPPAIERQLQALIRIAHARGFAVGIGHPHPTTLGVLERWLPTLAQQGVHLIPLSTLLTLTQQERSTWHASLSP